MNLSKRRNSACGYVRLANECIIQTKKTKEKISKSNFGRRRKQWFKENRLSLANLLHGCRFRCWRIVISWVSRLTRCWLRIELCSGLFASTFFLRCKQLRNFWHAQVELWIRNRPVLCYAHSMTAAHTIAAPQARCMCVCVCHTVWYQYALAQMTRCEFTYQLSVAQHNKKNIQSQIEFVLCCVCRVGILHLSGLFDGVWCRIPQRTKKRKDEKKTKLFYKHTQPTKKLIAAAAVSSSLQVWFAQNTEANFAIENRTHNLWLVLNLKKEKKKIAFRDWEKWETIFWWNLIRLDCVVFRAGADKIWFTSWHWQPNGVPCEK